MRDKKTTNISDNIKPYLDEIAERLWSNHAAVMVGAGFSKNAKLPPLKCFPDWNQLGNVFYKKIYGCLPNEAKSQHYYLNVLKLADEVRAAFGRPALDQLLRSEIPNEECEPSSLHKDLLELPWTDVFTTNYDTLLERACASILSKRFDVVVNKDDLIYSKRPRIIKLHGSFPSQRPFIISEEDYRKYPKEFAPFVNTVQQSLLENTLCLIGFSGDDPNFLQWLGWIRDNLGEKNAPKIYLVGILNISDAKKKLLEQCNIIPVDLSSPDIENNHARALKIFFEYLKERKQDFNRLEWPGIHVSFYFDDNKDIAPQIKMIVKKWKEQRESYPNWVIVPEDRRKLLWKDTKNWVNQKLFPKEIEKPLDIEFLYELNWRMEKSLCPIFSFLIEYYESTIDKYNPFPDLLKIESAKIYPGNSYFENSLWNELQIKWLDLNISMMRYYREKGILEKWLMIDNHLQKLERILSPEFIARWYYERCLHKFFSLNISQVQSILKNWPINDSLPFWEAKRASINAELGNLEAAKQILEKSLNSIRLQLNLSPVLNDYSLVSQESYVMWLLFSIKDDSVFIEDDQVQLEYKKQYEKAQEHIQKFNYNFIVRGVQSYKESDFIEPKEKEQIKRRREFKDRWDSLRQYKCDPMNELKLFEMYLEHEPIIQPSNYEEIGFDINEVTYIQHIGDEGIEVLTAYNFLRFFEEAGIPFRIPGMTLGKKALEGVLKLISQNSPYWALATLLRVGDIKLIDSVFNRESIFEIKQVKIDNLISEYLKALQDAKYEIEKENWYQIQLAKVIPEILSRLCVKCSENIQDNIFDFLIEIYAVDFKYHYKGISNLVKRLISSWPLSYQHQKIPELLKIPIICPRDFQIVKEFPEPFKFVDNELTTNSEKIQIETYEIEQLIKKSKIYK